MSKGMRMREMHAARPSGFYTQVKRHGKAKPVGRLGMARKQRPQGSIGTAPQGSATRLYGPIWRVGAGS